MTDTIILRAGGKKYSGWEKVQITRSLTAIAGTFQLDLTWRFNGNISQYNAFVKPIQQGQECTIEIGQSRVITGYVDDWIPSYDATTVTISVAGRDKTADLVDCSVVHASGQFKNQTLTQIAKTVCSPFGIDVAVETIVGAAFPRVQVEQGETAHEFLARLAAQRGVLLTTNAHGALVITRAKSTRAGVSLELGKNIQAARARFSWRQRFSEYIVKSSGASFGNWDSSPTSTVGGMKSTITDPKISRYRPTIIVNSEITTASGASVRGQWYRQRAIAQSNSAEYTVTGWRIPQTGLLWDINTIVPVHDAMVGLDGDYLISSVMFSEDNDNGRIAVLSVVSPDALTIPSQPDTSKKQTSTW